MTKPTKTPEKTEFTIKEAAKYMNLTEAYVRSLIRGDRLPSELRPIAFEAAVSRHIIQLTDIETFLKETTRKTKRNDGRNKYVMYLNPQEEGDVITALQNAKLGHLADMIHPANFLKPRGK